MNVERKLLVYKKEIKKTVGKKKNCYGYTGIPKEISSSLLRILDQVKTKMP